MFEDILTKVQAALGFKAMNIGQVDQANRPFALGYRQVMDIVYAAFAQAWYRIHRNPSACTVIGLGDITWLIGVSWGQPSATTGYGKIPRRLTIPTMMAGTRPAAGSVPGPSTAAMRQQSPARTRSPPSSPRGIPDEHMRWHMIGQDG